MYTATIVSIQNDTIENVMPFGIFSSQTALKKAGRNFISLLLRANPNWFLQHEKDGDNVLYSASDNKATVEIVVAEIQTENSANAIPMACCLC